ncbi:MAG: hypothetical protein C4K60_13635 [Ideonella sp. MAG2]|nr:MAG: hypothetical protein C4K60_13635 [Ideonella sp. MAG2]
MLRKLVLWVLGYAWVALLVGLGGLGMAAYSSYSAGHGGGARAEGELSAASGEVTEGREVTVEHKRRRGGKTTSKYFELDLKPDGGGELLKLRVDHAIPQSKLEPTIGSRVTARYDADDHNTVYVLNAGGTELVAYADMQRILVAKAESNSQFFGSTGMLVFFALVALVGGGGLVLRRKMLSGSA